MPSEAQRRRRRRNLLAALPFVAPGLLLFLLYEVYPLIQTVLLSFQQWDGFADRRWVGISNYQRAVSDALLWSALRHSLIYALGTMVAKVSISLALALLLDRTLRGRSFYRSVAFAPVLMSFVAVGLLWRLMYDPSLGLINQTLHALHLTDGTTTWLGSPTTALYSVMVVDVWKWVGYHTILFIAGLSLVSVDLLEVARIDGANAWQRFWHVRLPALRSVLVVNIIIAGAGAFNTFDLVYVMTQGGPYLSSEVTVTYMYRQAFTENQYGFASAIACALFLLVGAFTLIVLRGSRSDYDAA